MRKLNHLVRRWNVALLFGFPSAESVRIGSQMKELEAKNADLEASNAKLSAENAELRDEIRALKEGNGSQHSKKRRVS